MMQALNAQRLQYTNESQFPNGRHSRSQSTSPTPSPASSVSSNGTIPAKAANAPSRPASAASISSSASTATVRPSRPQQTNASLANPDVLVDTRSLSTPPQSASPSEITKSVYERGSIDVAAGDGHANGDASFTKDGMVTPFRDTFKNSGSTNGVVPLPTPPLYPNSRSENTTVSTATVLSSRVTSIVPFIQYYALNFYLRLAQILNERFNLDLPVDFDFPLPERPVSTFTYKPNLWHIVLIFLPLVLILRRASRPGSQHGGAGEAARRKLRAQQTSRSLFIGPYIGIGFWKAAMRAVSDAVSMGGKGLI